MPPPPSQLERNLRLYPWYAGALSTWFWMPVFFLYLSSRVSLREVLWLEAIYYVAVVVVEVPSGYLSDRLGRRPTLIAAAASLLAAYVLFALSGSFGGLALAQVLLAVGIACNSGTDTSFHHDALVACGRTEAYGEREAQLGRLTGWTSALGALTGGAAAMLDLRLAYVLSALSAVLALGVALRFVEPPREASSGVLPANFVAQLRRCLALTWSRPLGWFFVAGVFAVVVNHLPYEFYQGYLALVADALGAVAHATPLATGLHAMSAALVAGLVAGFSMRLARRLGLVGVVLMGFALQGALIAAMALWLSPVIAVLLVARSVPRALQRAPLLAAVAPRLGSELRATWLSIESLAGRLGYGATLAALSAGAGAAVTWPQLSALLARGAWLALALLAVLALSVLLHGWRSPE